MPSPSAVQEEKNTSIWITTKDRGKRKCSYESREGKEVKSEVERYQAEISSLFPHRAAQNHQTSNGIQAVLHHRLTTEHQPSGCLLQDTSHDFFLQHRKKTQAPFCFSQLPSQRGTSYQQCQLIELCMHRACTGAATATRCPLAQTPEQGRSGRYTASWEHPVCNTKSSSPKENTAPVCLNSSRDKFSQERRSWKLLRRAGFDQKLPATALRHLQKPKSTWKKNQTCGHAMLQAR